MSSAKKRNPASKKKATAAPLSILEALEDGALFGRMGFDAESWTAWLVFLAALFGLPMTPEQLAVYRRHTGRSGAPTSLWRYAQLVVGRRGGKSRILALIATFMACVLDHSAHLVPGERAVIAVIAKDRQQAKVILGYIVGFLKEIPLFAGLIEAEQAESVHLSNGVSIEIHTASIARHAVARSLLCFVMKQHSGPPATARIRTLK
jgi:hypothetical protein